MTNSATNLISELDAIDAAGGSSITPHSPRRVTVDSNVGEWEIVIQQLDRLAVSASSLSLSSPRLRRLDAAQIRHLSESLSDQLQYLLEPIRLIECDDEVAQVRSDPPSTEADNSRCYYELLVKNSGIALQRYQAAAGLPRRPIAMDFTRETLRRLCNDLEDSLAI